MKREEAGTRLIGEGVCRDQFSRFDLLQPSWKSAKSAVHWNSLNGSSSTAAGPDRPSLTAITAAQPTSRPSANVSIGHSLECPSALITLDQAVKASGYPVEQGVVSAVPRADALIGGGSL
jgi:hypothetical protein